ncbi:hypothetical protein [Asticcacaulis excentricus]|uniref:Uncharacterized protein n=1 Tax=Asticcacaulis excentricus TaxID=78587 RepID=A0A3G9G2D0_9CAUL|nr:hypothetical protein [Asticcacaulis excentricus]BBF79901.1 hypothetical protein EM6_0478 [Asticcacaulis excentricus]
MGLNLYVGAHEIAEEIARNDPDFLIEILAKLRDEFDDAQDIHYTFASYPKSEHPKAHWFLTVLANAMGYTIHGGH